MNKLSSRALFFVISLALLFSGSADVHALGISPGSFVFKNIRPDTTVVRTLNISRTDLAYDEMFTLEIDGNIPKSMISIPSSVTILAGENNINVPVQFSTNNIGKGEYRGNINIQKVPTPGEESMVTDVYLRLENQVTISVVSDEHHDSEVQNISLVNEENISVSFTGKNDGNVSESFSKIEVSLTSDNTLKKTTIDEMIPLAHATVDPFSEERFTFPVKATISDGFYKVSVRIYQGDTLVGEKNDIALTVGHIGQPRQHIQKKRTQLIPLYSGAAIVLLIGTLYYYKKTKE